MGVVEKAMKHQVVFGEEFALRKDRRNYQYDLGG